jgi:hypothetical protein
MRLSLQSLIQPEGVIHRGDVNFAVAGGEAPYPSRPPRMRERT